MTEQPLHQLLLRSQSAMHREVLTRAAELGAFAGTAQGAGIFAARGGEQPENHCGPLRD